MKKLEVAITREHLVATLKGIEESRENGTSMELARAAGFLEGMLYTLGEIKGKTTFKYKEIEYLEIGWFGQKKIRTREQTYLEYVIEKTKEVIASIEPSK